MSAITEIARRRGIAVVEDAAQAHAAEREGQSAGTFGDIGCFSFYPGKNLGACGEGGAAVTNRSDLADEMRLLRDWGQTAKYSHARHAYNYRMDNIQGAVLGVKLRYLGDWTARRRAIAARYDEALSGASAHVATPRRPVGQEHCYHVYAVRSRYRDEFRSALKAAGVTTGMHYPRPVHLQLAYRDLGYKVGDFPASEAFADETLSLPIYPEMTVEQVQQVCDSILRICEAWAPAERLGGLAALETSSAPIGGR
jgi:dTDP-4-amino-4,6-dideoxygalactose transaminase